MSKQNPLIGALALACLASAATAQTVGENIPWQFQTTADKVNQAAVQDMIQKRKNGYYAAPVYTTNIERQFNCNVASTAQGNQGTNSTIANSPTTSGNSASAIGNANTTDVGYRGGSAESAQNNTGSVGAAVNGSTSSRVSGTASQALNSTQTNSGDQYASVEGSTACQFGALN